MSYLELIHAVPDNLKKLFRKSENVCQKIINARWSITFNNVCLTENLMPIYTNMRLYDQALRNLSETVEYKKKLIKREISVKENILKQLYDEATHQDTLINNYDFDPEVKKQVLDAQQEFIQNFTDVKKTKILKKLNNLYNGSIHIKEDINYFLNLSNYTLNENEKNFLNLGLNMHINSKYDKLHKKNGTRSSV